MGNRAGGRTDRLCGKRVRKRRAPGPDNHTTTCYTRFGSACSSWLHSTVKLSIPPFWCSYPHQSKIRHDAMVPQRQSSTNVKTSPFQLGTRWRHYRYKNVGSLGYNYATKVGLNKSWHWYWSFLRSIICMMTTASKFFRPTRVIRLQWARVSLSNYISLLNISNDVTR